MINSSMISFFIFSKIAEGVIKKNSDFGRSPKVNLQNSTQYLTPNYQVVKSEVLKEKWNKLKANEATPSSEESPNSFNNPIDDCKYIKFSKID